MLFFDFIFVDKISVQWRGLNIKDIPIELLKILVWHLLLVHLQKVAEDDLDLLHANAASSIEKLFSVGFHIVRLIAQDVSIVFEDVRNFMARFFLDKPGLCTSGTLPLASEARVLLWFSCKIHFNLWSTWVNFCLIGISIIDINFARRSEGSISWIANSWFSRFRLFFYRSMELNFWEVSQPRLSLPKLVLTRLWHEKA